MHEANKLITCAMCINMEVLRIKWQTRTPAIWYFGQISIDHPTPTQSNTNWYVVDKWKKMHTFSIK